MVGVTRKEVTGRSAESWFDRPMRWGQLTLTETDPLNYDVNFWLDYFRESRCDAVCLSAGGCVCYYPTQIPFHFRSPWLGERDAFGELVAGCRRLGMNVIGRTDPHAVHDDLYEAHPDWVMRGSDGEAVRHWADPTLWVTCALGPYNFEYMTAVSREIMQMYGVDGIFANRWAGHGICYCVHCQQNFRAATGYDLPYLGEKPVMFRILRGEVSAESRRRNAPALHAYLGWWQDRLFELWDVWDATIRAVVPEARFIANSGGATGLLDMRRIGERAQILFADRQARHGVQPVWVNGRNGKEYRSTLGNKPIGGIFSMGVEEPYRWKDSVQSPAEVRLFVADGVANGLRPWYTKFGGVVYDPRWLKPVAEMYQMYAEWEPYLRNVTSRARVGLVYSQQTWNFYGGDRAHKRVEDHTQGFYHALVEARVPFEMVHDGLLDAEHIGHLKTLILPNVAALSDAQCEQLRAFVAGGGGLVATFESSLYDEFGQKRADFGLADLFGASFAGNDAGGNKKVSHLGGGHSGGDSDSDPEHEADGDGGGEGSGIEGPMRNSYLAIERDPMTRQFHPLVAGLEDAGRIINGVSRVLVKGNPTRTLPRLGREQDGRAMSGTQETKHSEKSYSPLMLIPSYPDLPMEMLWPRVTELTEPQLFYQNFGKGRVVYFPFDIARSFWEFLTPDHGRLLANAVEWATNEVRPVVVEGPGVLDVTVWEQARSMTVHLVNLSNPMLMKGPVRELLPVGEQVVRVQLPANRQVAGVHLLRAGVVPEVTMGRASMTVRVPSVLDHEVIAIDFVG